MPSEPRVWFAIQGGERIGPLAEERLFKLVADKGIKKEDFVWREGMEKWCLAGEVAELRNLFPIGSPDSGSLASGSQSEQAPRSIPALPPKKPNVQLAGQPRRREKPIESGDVAPFSGGGVDLFSGRMIFVILLVVALLLSWNAIMRTKKSSPASAPSPSADGTVPEEVSSTFALAEKYLENAHRTMNMYPTFEPSVDLTLALSSAGVLNNNSVRMYDYAILSRANEWVVVANSKQKIGGYIQSIRRNHLKQTCFVFNASLVKADENCPQKSMGDLPVSPQLIDNK